MFSHFWGMRVAAIVAAALSLGACRTFSPDGGMDTVAMVAGTGLNKDVVHALRLHLPPEPVSIIEVGAGIGTMLKRLVNWDIFCSGHYTLVDSIEQNIDYARDWIPQWAAEAGLSAASTGHDSLHLCGAGREIQVCLVCADVFDFIGKNRRPADVGLYLRIGIRPPPGIRGSSPRRAASRRPSSNPSAGR